MVCLYLRNPEDRFSNDEAQFKEENQTKDLTLSTFHSAAIL